jgi:hypothetical protein
LTTVARDLLARILEHGLTDQVKELCHVTDSCLCVLKGLGRALQTCREDLFHAALGDNITRAELGSSTEEPATIRDLRVKLTANNTILCFLIQRYTLNNIFKSISRQDPKFNEVLEWLGGADYESYQNDLIATKQPGTGQWFLDSPEYKHWIAAEKEVLICPGHPGAGKTMLAAIVIQDLRDRFRDQTEVGVCYAYRGFKGKKPILMEDLMVSLVRQLSKGRNSLPVSVYSLYKKCIAKYQKPTLEELYTTLQQISVMYSRLFIVLDGANECREYEECESFISRILNFGSGFGANVMVTSRYIPDIMANFRGRTSIPIRCSDDDLDGYVERMFSQNKQLAALNSELQNDIKEAVIKASDGMYVLSPAHECPR